MKAIVALTPEEYAKLYEKLSALNDAIKGLKRDELFTFTKKHGYAKYTFNGIYSDKLVEALGRHPDEEEIIMLVDSGYSHFGASCTINKRDKTFSGHVYID
jgi:hypothetical protein